MPMLQDNRSRIATIGVIIILGLIISVLVVRYTRLIRSTVVPTTPILGTIARQHFQTGPNTVTVTIQRQNGQTLPLSQQLILQPLLTSPAASPVVSPAVAPSVSPTRSPQPSVSLPIPSPRSSPIPVVAGTQCLWSYIDDTPPPQLLAFEPRTVPQADHIKPDTVGGEVALFQLSALPDDFGSAIYGGIAATPRNRPVWFRLLKQDREPIVPYRIPSQQDANYNYVMNLINEGKAGPALIGNNMNLGSHLLSVHGSPTGGTFRLTVQDRYGSTQTAPITYVAADAEQTRANIYAALQQLTQSRPQQQIAPAVTARSTTEFTIDYRSSYLSYGTIPVDDRFSLGLPAQVSLQGGVSPHLEIASPASEAAWKNMLLSALITSRDDFLEAFELRVSYNKKRGGTGYVVLKPIADVATESWRGYPHNPAACTPQ